MNRFILFLTIALGVLFGAHYYLWARLVRDTALPQPWRSILTLVVIFFALFLPATLIFGRQLPREILRPVSLVAFAWMGFAFLLLVLLFLGDLLRLFFWIWSLLTSNPPPDPERRTFLARLTGGLVSVLGVLGGFAGAGSAFGPFRIERVKVPLARLPEPLSGTTLAQITDLHIGATLGKSFVERVVEEVNNLSPDIIAITGDLVDGSVEELRAHVAPLGNLRARLGVYFVTGNHEYYAGVEPWVEELGRLGIRVLRNERVSIGRGELAFDLVGIDDFNAFPDEESHAQALAEALSGRDPEREVVLLAHQPRSIHAAAAQGVSLQLSGHTHGGQIYPWRFLVGLQQPFVAGLDRLKETWIYVSRGTGFWGPPMRIGAAPEISLIELQSVG